MRINIHTIDDGRTPGFEQMPCGTITPKAGMLLKVVNGKLAMASGKDEPAYLSVTERETPCEDGHLITVIRVAGDMVLSTETPETFTAKIGEKVTIGTDGVSITNTKGGACEIVYTDDETTHFRLAPVAAASGGAG